MQDIRAAARAVIRGDQGAADEEGHDEQTARLDVLLSSDITHVVFEGLDGYRSIVLLEDALADDVLIAERLDGQPLDNDHGAPVRLVSPNQYGFISTKHLCRIELHTSEPRTNHHDSQVIQLGLSLVKPHPRARVWQEERHRYLPARTARPIYRLLICPFKFLSARGSGLEA